MSARRKPETLSEVVTRCRAASGMSLREVAAATNGKLSHQMIANVERGDRRLVDPDRIRALAQALGEHTTYEELMTAAGYTRSAGKAGSLSFSVLLADVPELTERDIEEIEAFAAFIIDKRRKSPRVRR